MNLKAYYLHYHYIFKNTSVGNRGTGRSYQIYVGVFTGETIWIVAIIIVQMFRLLFIRHVNNVIWEKQNKPGIG